MKTTLIVGNNNFWYATGVDVKNVDKYVDTVAQQIKNGDFDDQHNEPPTEIYVYEATELKTIKI